MKVTNEELLKLFKLKVGDEIVIKDYMQIGEPCKARVTERKTTEGTGKILLNIIDYGVLYPLSTLAMCEYDFYKPEKIGDTTCYEYTCFECPLRHLADCDNDKDEETLYKKLNGAFETNTDDPIYKAYKAILDKEE